MKTEKQQTTSYTIEREFLAEFSCTELIRRIIRIHTGQTGQHEEPHPLPRR